MTFLAADCSNQTHLERNSWRGILTDGSNLAVEVSSINENDELLH
jgi:hypothetical protein